jgi:hypothetical protein
MKQGLLPRIQAADDDALKNLLNSLKELITSNDEGNGEVAQDALDVLLQCQAE